MPERSAPDYAAEGIMPSAEPGVPSYALQSLMERRETQDHNTQVGDQHATADDGVINLHQFGAAQGNLHHLSHFGAVGTRIAMGQTPGQAIRGHVDVTTGMYRMPEDTSLSPERRAS